MSNFIKVDVSSLSSYQNDFNNEHNYFNNKTYTTFTSGYLKSCGDQYINQMASHLKSYYERVEIGYRNINTWWTGYVNDVEALEKLLSGEGNAAGIEEPAVISAIAKLFNIDTYENTLDGTFGEQGGDYGSAFSFDDQSAIDMANANVFGENDTSTSQNFNILNATGATVLTAVGGAAEGFLSKGENVVDAALVAGTATLTSSAPVALIDLIQKGYSKISGKEVELLSDKIWDSTKAFVAKDHVKTMFNDFYENNSYGQWIKNNAIGFDVVRNFSAGLGGIAFNFTVSALTGGTIPPSAVAAVTDFGAGTAQAWAEGASTEAGMVYGMGHAAIGYITYASGEKTKLIKNPFVRAGVDGGINTAGDGVDEILKIATYKKGYTNKEGEYVEFTDDDNIFDRVGRVYEESGGFKNAVTQFALGAARSYVGEKITDGVGKFTNKVGKWWNKFRRKNAKPDIEVLDAKPAIDDSKAELPPNQTIIDTEGHLVDFDYETLDGDIIEDYPSGSFSGEAAKNYSPEIEKLAGVDRKGLPAGPDEVGLATNEPKNLVSGAAEKIESDGVIDAFDDVEMPKQTPKGLDSGIERIDIAEPKTIATVSDSLGDRSALDAFDDVEMPKQTPKGLDSGIKPQETAVPKFTKFDTGKGIDYYIQNIEEFNKNGVSLKQYIENSGEKVISINTNSDLATYFGDGKLFTLDKLKQLSSNPNLSSNERSAIKTLYDIYSDVRVANIDTLKLLNDAAPYLSGSDMEQIMNLLNSGLADTMAQSYSSEQLASIFNYTATGFEMNAWLNDGTINYGKDKAREIYRDIFQIQNEMSGTFLEVDKSGNIIRNKIFSSDRGSILDELDSVITSANYSDNIVAYRGIKELYDGHQQLDISKLKIGDSFISEGYQSASVLFDNNYGATHADTGIILEVLVPANSGTGCYIENISGCKNYCQTEILLKRNAKMTVSGDIYKKVVNGIEKTIIPVIIQ